MITNIGYSEGLDAAAAMYGIPPGQEWYFDDVPGQYFNQSGNQLPIDSSNAPAAFNVAKSTSDFPTLASIVSAVPQLITGLTAFQLSQVNVERARRGLSPLNASAYGPQVGVTVAPQTMSTILMLAVGLGAVFLLSRSR